MYSEKLDRKFISWNTEPIVFAILKSLTPADIKTDFIDERYEPIQYSADYDLVVFSVKTYNARNTYSISDRFRQMGIKTIAGGYHIILNPDEAAQHFDSIVLGDAESTWPGVMNDLKNNSLQTIYRGNLNNGHFAMPDRSIYDKYGYLPLHLVESSRGCPYRCRFCSTASVFKSRIIFRDTTRINNELKQLRNSIVLFTDENITADKDRLMAIAGYAGSHNIKWIAQADISVSRDSQLLKHIAGNGCKGLLIGFESMSDKMLKAYNKGINVHKDYIKVIKKLHHYGIMVYAAFFFDTGEYDTLNMAYDFIMKNNPDLCGMHPLIPFPGTPVYEDKSKSIPSVENWWIKSAYPYFHFVFRNNDSRHMESLINSKRSSIYSLKGIIRRIDWTRFVNHPSTAFFSVLLNLLGMAEVKSKSHITNTP